ncbi:MAG: PcfJ domain-containing protein [Motiliproteus sp.]
MLDTIKHEKELSFDLLGFIRRYKSLSNSTLSKYYSRSGRPLRSAMNATIGDIFRLSGYVEGKVSLHEIRKCSSLEDLEWIHDRLMNRLNLQLDSGYEVAFPTPPLNGNEHIVAIENGSELKIEGRSMCHCIYSYLHEVLDGRYYAFRVLWPERATLGVWIESCGGSQRVRLDQLKGRKNTAVAKQTEDFVTAWISGKSDRR